QQWSPEQIQYRLRHENSQHSISSATIYRAIYMGLFNDPDWVRSGKRNLRHRGKKRLYKGAKITRGGFAISHEISERPAEAQARARLGDWKADTVAGITGGAVQTTLTDRKSRFLHCVRLEKKTADGVNAAIIEALSGEILHSITPDRGKEFARHAEVTKALGAEFYFPPPYQPWQRGTNENTNGLLREFFPKHQDIAQYSDEYIEKCVWKLNNRPRKCLQWRTPYEVHFDKALHLV
uniref:IS30 family transposase n=2 Tax=Cardiobacterium hominis TaxID=2718 RepID=UPI000661730B